MCSDSGSSCGMVSQGYKDVRRSTGVPAAGGLGEAEPGAGDAAPSVRAALIKYGLIRQRTPDA